MKKIAFIGMMGCGKSSIANDISKDLALKLISIDKMVEKELNLSISDIFEKFGEPYFRKIETKILKNAVINESCIIDCGGGIILDSSNIEILKNNGYSIIFIDRNPEKILEEIDVNNRPLVKDNPTALIKIYNERIGLYKKYSDYIIENNNDYDYAINSVKSLIINL